jgi:hypothetical protein
VLRMVETTAYALVASRCRYRMLHAPHPRQGSAPALRHVEKEGTGAPLPEVERDEDQEEHKVLVGGAALAL